MRRRPMVMVCYREKKRRRLGERIRGEGVPQEDGFGLG